MSVADKAAVLAALCDQLAQQEAVRSLIDVQTEQATCPFLVNQQQT